MPLFSVIVAGLAGFGCVAVTHWRRRFALVLVLPALVAAVQAGESGTAPWAARAASPGREGGAGIRGSIPLADARGWQGVASPGREGGAGFRRNIPLAYARGGQGTASPDREGGAGIHGNIPLADARGGQAAASPDREGGAGFRRNIPLAYARGWQGTASPDREGGAQPATETDYIVYTDSPRLLLHSRRLRLMQRERERESMRWMQFEALMAGGAVMPEPGFARALYGIVTARRDACRSAAEWAAAESNAQLPAVARQAALVYDWCAASLDGPQANALARRLTPLLSAKPAEAEAVRSMVFAAVALADLESKASQQALRYAVEQWWRGRVLPALLAGEQPFKTRAALYAMVEILHAIRDNLRIDLREGCEKWFEELPPRLLLGYYPQPWPEAGNEFRIPAYSGSGDPDLREAALARAAEFALVAYDTNAQIHQFLQGWLMMDRFLMRGTFGAPYELLWANPYQPGLSYTYMPELYHANGLLLARSSWEEDATWFSYQRDSAQAFQNGRRININLNANLAPVRIGAVKVFFAPGGLRFETGWEEPPEAGERKPREEYAFIVGLEPDKRYDVEADDQEMDEARTDSGGILALRFPAGQKTNVRIKLAAPLGR